MRHLVRSVFSASFGRLLDSSRALASPDRLLDALLVARPPVLLASALPLRATPLALASPMLGFPLQEHGRCQEVTQTEACERPQRWLCQYVGFLSRNEN